MTTQTDPIRVGRGSLLERDDLGYIAATLDMQTSWTMTLLALYALLRVECMAKILCDVAMTGTAGICTDRSCTFNMYVLCIRRD